MVSTNSAASHITCRSCDERYDLELTEFPCQNCGGILDIRYQLDDIEISRQDIERRSGSVWKYQEFLPIRDTNHIITMGEGNTPLVEAPGLAEQLGVARVVVKDEGQNPTNTFKDRGATASVSAAYEQGIDQISLPSAGNAGQAAAAYAAKAGIECHVFLPYQAGSIQKELVQIHGAKLHLVAGDLSNAGASCSEARLANGWYSVATFQSPFRHEGKKTLGYEIFEQYGWTAPDEIFYPTGGGVGLIGIWKAYLELRELGWLETTSAPSLNVVQSTGCSPVVRAILADDVHHTAWEAPNSIGRGIEVPDPSASDWIIEAVNATDGTGVSVSDEAALRGAIELAQADGVEICVEPGAAVAGAIKQAERGNLDSDDEILIVNTGAGTKASDIVSSAL